MNRLESIDLNADLGEGGAHDEALLELVSSASIACGAHAGDETTMRVSVARAKARGVSIGAHPGYADRAHFGRRELVRPAAEIAELVRGQVATLQAIASGEGATLAHVKPHGALYNQAARDAVVAAAVVAGVVAVSRELALFAPGGSVLARMARAAGLVVRSEAFADRRYQDNGELVPRSVEGAVILNVAAAVAQARSIVLDQCVVTLAGARIPLTADTLCVHGDGTDVVAVVRALRAAFFAAGVQVGKRVTKDP